MQKSREAFRTISEVADWLEVPAHVLRFWETRFTQIKPTKRAGGRRYYRPADMLVIGGIKTLLHDRGMTIRGVQKLFREQGVSHVSSFSIPLEAETTEQEAQGQIEAVADDAPQIPSPAPPDKSDDEVGLTGTDFSEEENRPREEAGSAEVLSGHAAPAAGREDPGEPAAETMEPAGAASRPAGEASEEIAASDILASDPEDDAEGFAQGPGIAARVMLADPRRLRTHRDKLLKAVERLRALQLSRSEDS